LSFDKRYTVISTQTPRGPVYRIYDRLNECSIEGGFDTQKWAEAVAEMMESKWRKENEKHKRNTGSKRNVTEGTC
jgi:hypothetical protein